MGAPPRISVVIPCYDQARFLPESVASVAAQTEPSWECIIVDDGSPDDAAAVAAELIARYPRSAIRLLRQPNRGLSAARNAGVAAARAAYILPLDADDALEPQLLARTAGALDARPDVGFVYTDVVLFGAERGIWSGGGYSLGRLRFDNPAIPVTLFRRAAWQQVGGFAEEMRQGFEDWDFWLRLAEAGWQGLHLPEPLVRYRRSAGSMLTRSWRKDLELRAEIIRRHPRLYEPAFVRWSEATLARAGDPKGAARRARAFLGYVAVLARHRPQALPKALLRPLFQAVPVSRQQAARRLARALGISRGRRT